MTHPALLEQAALELRRAIVLPGPQPQWHRSVLSRHRAEWPALWSAIDGVLAALEHEPAGSELDDPGPAESMTRRIIAEALEGYGGVGLGVGDLEYVEGAFEVESDPAMRCGADVAGFRCTRAIGHDGRHWSSSTTDVARRHEHGDGLNGE